MSHASRAACRVPCKRTLRGSEVFITLGEGTVTDILSKYYTYQYIFHQVHLTLRRNTMSREECRLKLTSTGSVFNCQPNALLCRINLLHSDDSVVN